MACARLAQAGMFLLLGLLVTPSKWLDARVPGLTIALPLIVVARPLAVALCLWPLRFAGHEIGFVAWVARRGAVPIVLALLLIQGATIGRMARRLGVALPTPSDEAGHRAVFRDVEPDPRTPAGQVGRFDDLPAPPEAELAPADWVAQAL